MEKEERYMVKIIGVRFKPTGKMYFFDPLDYDIKQGMHVVVETSRGYEYGEVTSGVKEVDPSIIVKPLKGVIRIATAEDTKKHIENKEKEKEAYRICKDKIREHDLNMKLIEVEYTFDGNKILFYFTADGRVDFRELVKDLAAVFRTRIELRQIGVRDESKALGSVGMCGRNLCCAQFLDEFVPVSVKMAKEQGLSLNPAKISGVCGRLMCCLKYEQDTYEFLTNELPKVGETVKTPDGEGMIVGVELLREKVKVKFDNGDEMTQKDYDVAQITTSEAEQKANDAKELKEKRTAAKRAKKREKAKNVLLTPKVNEPDAKNTVDEETKKRPVTRQKRFMRAHSRKKNTPNKKSGE